MAWGLDQKSFMRENRVQSSVTVVLGRASHLKCSCVPYVLSHVASMIKANSTSLAKRETSVFLISALSGCQLPCEV